MPAKGSKVGPRPDEVKASIAAGVRATLRERPPWSQWFAPIKRAADAGNRREAIRLLDEYIKSREAA